MKSFQRDGGPGGRKGGKKFGVKSTWNRAGGYKSTPRPSMHPATCNGCGSPCEVPFKPTGSKPIYCSNCFKRDEAKAFSPRHDHGDHAHADFDEKPSFPAKCDKCGNSCEVPFRPNGKKPVFCSMCFTKSDAAPSANVTELKDQFRTLNAKLDAILNLLNTAVAEVEAEDAEADEDDEETEA